MKLEIVNEKMKMKFGKATNGMDIITIGEGSKSILLMYGGPGNLIIPNYMGKPVFKAFNRIINKDYTISIVSRKSNLTMGYTIKNMAEDVIELIEQDFGGHIDVLIGSSYGGFLLLELAALRPDISDKFIMHFSAYKVADVAHAYDRQFAKFMSNGEVKNAMLLYADKLINSPLKTKFVKLGLKVAGGLARNALKEYASPTFSKDILIEAEAEVAFNAENLLPQIEVPMLVIGVDNDFWFPEEFYRKTAEMIKGSKAVIIPNKTHGDYLTEEVEESILAYI